MKNVDTIGGIWKTKINQVGTLITAHPEDTPKLMLNLLTNYLSSKLTEGPSLFNIIPFISEFLAIHPYEDGNGRISLLIMNKELYNAGYKFAKYVSISKFLWKKKDEYILALEKRNKPWSSNLVLPKDLIPLFNVFLDALINANQKALKYQELKKYSKKEFAEELKKTFI